MSETTTDAEQIVIRRLISHYEIEAFASGLLPNVIVSQMSEMQGMMAPITDYQTRAFVQHIDGEAVTILEVRA